MTIDSVWAQDLQQASWRQVPFAVRESTIIRGRRTTTHEYPFRDDVYVEDLGRGVRRYTFRGFLVGDNVFDQRDAMVEAAEAAGPGTLVHPSLGSKRVSLITFAASERMEAGRSVDLDFTFVETGQVLFPTAANATQSQTVNAAGAAQAGAVTDFGDAIAGPVAVGA